MSIDGTEPSVETLLEREEEIEELTSHIEEFVRTEADERTYFSTDIYAMAENKVTLDIYGIEGHPMPEKRTITEAVGDFYGWTAGFEEGRSEDDMYSIRVVRWE